MIGYARIHVWIVIVATALNCLSYAHVPVGEFFSTSCPSGSSVPDRLDFLGKPTGVTAADDHVALFKKCVKNSHSPWLIQFHSSMCETCQAFQPVWKNLVSKLHERELALKYGRVDIDTEGAMECARNEHVLDRGVPGIFFFSGKGALAGEPVYVYESDGVSEEAAFASLDQLQAIVARRYLSALRAQDEPISQPAASVSETDPAEIQLPASPVENVVPPDASAVESPQDPAVDDDTEVARQAYDAALLVQPALDDTEGTSASASSIFTIIVLLVLLALTAWAATARGRRMIFGPKPKYEN